jgi:putative salt-induced outer membrane protein YdiY
VIKPGKLVLFLVFYLLATLSLQAQILNIEKTRIDNISPEKPYEITFETKFSLFNRSASENDRAEFVSFSNKLNAIYAPGKHSYIVLGNLIYTENNNEPILNNGYLHIRTNFNFRNKWSYEAFGQIQDDKFRGLRSRYVVGGSVRWRSIENEKFELIVGSGPMFEEEVWANLENDEEETVDLLKLSTYGIVRWSASESFDLNTIVYYQVGYDQSIDKARHRISSTTNLNFRITKVLAFTASVALAYENQPIFPITKLIYGIENGILLRF